MGILNLSQNRIIYDHKTNLYSVGGMEFPTFAEAKSKQWKCDKCLSTFGSMKELRVHKIDRHSY